jgi:hypothetical protein
MGTFADKPATVGGFVYQARDRVDDRMDVLEAFTNERWEETYQFVQDYQQFMAELVIPNTTIDNISFPSIMPLHPELRPSLGALNINTSIPENSTPLPTLYPPVEFTNIDIPVMSFQPPTWETPDKPTTESIQAPGDAPTINQVNVPTAPSLTLPTVPILDDISLPVAPDITLPEFDGTVPADIGELTNSFSWTPEAYNSDIWADLLSKVLSDIRNGGTGLSVNVEQELYDRALARQQAENDRMYQEIESKFGSSGFDLPDGALTSALLQASSQVSRNNTEINGQITIDQSKLAQTNTHFMIEQGGKLEGMLREFYHQAENRAFEAQKAIAQTAIDTYNSTVSVFNANIDRYKSEAIVFEARTKAALTEIEIFKGKIESAKVSAEVQKNLVDIYQAQLGAVETQMKLFVAEMEGAKIASEVEMSRIEIFKAQVQAYVSQLEGQKMRYEAYATEMQAEGIKADIFRSQVGAYVAEIEAVKAKASIIATEAEINTRNNSLLIDEYKAKLLGYSAEVDAKAKSIGSQVEGFRAEAGAYEAESSALGMYYGTKIKEMEVGLAEVDARVRKSIAEIDATTKGYVALKNVEAEGHKGVMNVGAQLVSSAMNAINTNLSFGGTYTSQYGVTHHTGSSLSETHNFDETKS